METKTNKMLKVILITLIMALVCCISLGGIYLKKQNRWENILPEYTLGTSLKGYREVGLKVDDSKKEVIKDADGKIMESATEEEIAEKGYTKEEVPVNIDQNLTKENYINTKKLIENRLKEIGEQNYEVRLNEETGRIVVKIKEDDKKEMALSLLSAVGKFEIQDSDTQEVLMDNRDIKGAKLLYQTTTTGTTVYMDIEFNKEGKAKLAEISKKYVESTDENGNTTKKQIEMIVDDSTLVTTSFTEPIENGSLQLTLGRGSATDNSTLQSYIDQGNSMKVVLNNGPLPVAYTAETNQYIQMNTSQENFKLMISIAAAVIVILVAYRVIRYHLNGLFSILSTITMLAITLLFIRFTNVAMSVESIIALIVVAILDYIFQGMILKRRKTAEDKSFFKATTLRFTMIMIPVVILAVVFCFMANEVISNMGMVIFWGIISLAIENLIFTKNVLVDIPKKERNVAKNEKE